MVTRLTLDGVVRGQTIDLAGETGLPDGTHVHVTVEAPSLTLAEKRATVRRLSGIWADDSSIKDVFDEIARERGQRLPRSVDLDDNG